MTIHYYKSGSTYVAVETCLPGQGFMQVGVGTSKKNAVENLKGTIYDGDSDPWQGVELVSNQLDWSETIKTGEEKSNEGT